MADQPTSPPVQTTDLLPESAPPEQLPSGEPTSPNQNEPASTPSSEIPLAPIDILSTTSPAVTAEKPPQAETSPAEISKSENAITTMLDMPASPELGEPAATQPNETAPTQSTESTPAPPSPPMPSSILTSQGEPTPLAPEPPPVKKSRKQGIILATLLLLLLTLPLAVYFVAQQKQLAEIRSRAAIIPGPYNTPTGVPKITIATSPTPTPYCLPVLHADCVNGCIPDSNGGKCRQPTPTLTPTLTKYPTPPAGIACHTSCCGDFEPQYGPGSCGGCPSGYSCRINNGSCTSGYSCGKIDCFPNGQACAGNDDCCSGGCDPTKHVCFGGNPISACPRNATTVCKDNNGTPGGGLSCSGSGTSCQFGKNVYCCYGDSGNSCTSAGGPDGGCYGGTGVTCSGGTITNNTQATITVKRYKGNPGAACPPAGDGMTNYDGSEELGPGGSTSANACEQIDARGYCGQCKGGCGGGTPPPGAPSCQQVKVYQNGAVVTQFSTLKAGDAIVFAASGANAAKARIRVNSGTGWSDWTETSTKNASGEYTLPYTIPTTANSVSVEAEVFVNGNWY